MSYVPAWIINLKNIDFLIHFNFTGELQLDKSWNQLNFFEYYDLWRQSIEYPSWRLFSTVWLSPWRMCSTFSSSTSSFNSSLLWLVYNSSMESSSTARMQASMMPKSASKIIHFCISFYICLLQRNVFWVCERGPPSSCTRTEMGSQGLPLW